MKRIAIFNQNRNFYGTQILQIPFLQFLAKAYPDSERIIFTSNSLSRMFSELDLVDEVVEMKGYLNIASQLNKMRPDLLFCFRRHSDFLNLLISARRKTCTVGFSSTITRA
ncbi:MAG: hypothetical protein KAG66_24735, partial [Methylococcales bacterium]|nr:hypothetical protein [Methylococcales bacterium]